MFNNNLIRCLVTLGVVFLFGVGYHFYNSHVEFREFMRGRLEFNKTFLDIEGLDTETSQHSLDNPDDETNDSTALGEQDRSTYDKQKWATYWSNQKPVKVRYAQTGMPDDEGVRTVPNVGPPKVYNKENLIPQLVETPDGQVHKMYWFEKLKPGQAVPPPEEWLFLDQVIVDGVMYDVPEGETSDSYIDKIRLSTIYDVPLESVESLIEEGVILSSPIDAQNDPLFVKREDSRPVEARSALQLSDWGLSNDELDEMTMPRPVETEMVMLDGEMAIIDAETGTVIVSSGDSGETEGVSTGEIDTALDSTSEQSPLADDSDNSLADALEKPKLPESMVAPEKQLTPARTEAELTEGVSPKLVDKAHKRIDRYGTTERLRRLREAKTNSETARQFEPERSPKPARDVPDNEQSER